MYLTVIAWRLVAGLCLVAATGLMAGCSGESATDREPAEANASAVTSAARRDGRYSDPRFGWTVSLPERFQVAVAERRGRVWFSGAAFASFPLKGDPLTVLEQAPSDGVALLIGNRSGGPAPDHFRSEARLPLELADFGLLTRSTAPVAKRGLAFSANGWEFQARAYIGRDATPQHREALRRVVASLRFPPLDEGSVTGDGFYVLGQSKRYPVGSVTGFGEADLPQAASVWRRPFFLIHAPGGFYAVGHAANLRGGFPACQVRFDATRFEFFCPNRARWDRLGRVIANPDPGRYRDDPLVLFAAKVGQDGHVLVSPNAYTLANAPLARRLWPRS